MGNEMKRLLILTLFTSFICNGADQKKYFISSDLKKCTRSSDCNDGEVCLSYTNCKGKQVKKCVLRSCHRSGVDCHPKITCINKHCGEVSCTN